MIMYFVVCFWCDLGRFGIRFCVMIGLIVRQMLVSISNFDSVVLVVMRLISQLGNRCVMVVKNVLFGDVSVRFVVIVQYDVIMRNGYISMYSGIMICVCWIVFGLCVVKKFCVVNGIRQKLSDWNSIVFIEKCNCELFIVLLICWFVVLNIGCMLLICYVMVMFVMMIVSSIRMFFRIVIQVDVCMLEIVMYVKVSVVYMRIRYSGLMCQLSFLSVVMSFVNCSCFYGIRNRIDVYVIISLSLWL